MTYHAIELARQIAEYKLRGLDESIRRVRLEGKTFHCDAFDMAKEITNEKMKGFYEAMRRTRTINNCYTQ